MAVDLSSLYSAGHHSSIPLKTNRTPWTPVPLFDANCFTQNPVSRTRQSDLWRVLFCSPLAAMDDLPNITSQSLTNNEYTVLIRHEQKKEGYRCQQKVNRAPG
ncbi:hypothetical protein LMZ02_27450 [Paenibacillus macerans]|uniref:hypothetical protein n=1 Tax=Paenibacillus macerans TaxID=44252 RepID=UPI001F0F8EC7|nr:hypothetical protein [Paenibacillus macerans]UMV47153.1 hypothetical protein LMZ02_27450 [Paenibacillus macerans]